MKTVSRFLPAQWFSSIIVCFSFLSCVPGAERAQSFTLRTAKALAMTAVDVVCSPDLLTQVRENFRLAKLKMEKIFDTSWDRLLAIRQLEVGSKFPWTTIIYTTVGFILIQYETTEDLWGRFVEHCGDPMYFKFWSGLHLLTLWKLFVALKRSGMKWGCLFDVFFPPCWCVL